MNRCLDCGKLGSDVKIREGLIVLPEFGIDAEIPLCEECYEREVAEVQKAGSMAPPRYTGIRFTPETGRITGRTYVGGLKGKADFAIDVRLFALDLAMEFDPCSIRQFMEMSDVPKSSLHGYDWRDISGSSDRAKEGMFAIAKDILKQHHARLAQMGLPNDVIERIA